MIEKRETEAAKIHRMRTKCSHVREQMGGLKDEIIGSRTKLHDLQADLVKITDRLDIIVTRTDDAA